MKPTKRKGDFFMNNNLTEIVFILDRSGSMAGLVLFVIFFFLSMILYQTFNN